MKPDRAAVLALASACALATLARGAPPLSPTPVAQANYMLNCRGCHLADGSGAAGKVPSLRDSLPILAASEAGRRYLVQVPGAAQSALSNLELAQVLNFMVRTLSARPPARWSEFSEQEVWRYRRAPLVDVRGTRARVLAGGDGATARR
jgi:mono/diheme cytochrome c family protein